MLSDASVIFVTILLLTGCNALAINKGHILHREVIDLSSYDQVVMPGTLVLKSLTKEFTEFRTYSYA